MFFSFHLISTSWLNEVSVLVFPADNFISACFQVSVLQQCVWDMSEQEIDMSCSNSSKDVNMSRLCGKWKMLNQLQLNQ